VGYITGMELNFESFSFKVFLCAIACAVVFIFSLVSTTWKKPVFAFSYFSLTIMSTIIMLYVAKGMGEHQAEVSKVYSTVCSNKATMDKLNDDYSKMINKYMCYFECPCNSGASEVKKNLWKTYPLTKTGPFVRTTATENE